MNTQKITKKIKIGGKGAVKTVFLGGNAEIPIQTMWKSPLDTSSLNPIVRHIGELEQLGCEILRFAVPDMDAADAFVRLTGMTTMPLVADIHFDHRLALRCMDGYTAKVRINPGNIGIEKKVHAVVEKARSTGTALRIGVNSGSIPSDLNRTMKQEIKEGKPAGEARAEALVRAALRESELFEALHFEQFLVSMKASSVKETIFANEMFSNASNIPLHLGVTEAGPLVQGIVKSTIAFTSLLQKDIGATIRVSLSDSMENEIIAAREILTECGKRTSGIRIISCPRCGRNGFDVHGFIKRWQTRLLGEKKSITIAVMGCVVNGPGEGKHADLGIAGAEDFVLLFKHGTIIQRINLNGLTEYEKEHVVDTAFEKELLTI